MASNVSYSHDKAKQISPTVCQPRKSIPTSRDSFVNSSGKHSELSHSSASDIENNQNIIIQSTLHTKTRAHRNEESEARVLQENMKGGLNVQATSKEQGSFDIGKVPKSPDGDIERYSDNQSARDSIEYRQALRRKASASRAIERIHQGFSDKENIEEPVRRDEVGYQHMRGSIEEGTLFEGKQEKAKGIDEKSKIESDKSFPVVYQFQARKGDLDEVKKPALKISTAYNIDQPKPESKSASEISSKLLNKSSPMQYTPDNKIPSQPTSPENTSLKPPLIQTPDKPTPYQTPPEITEELVFTDSNINPNHEPVSPSFLHYNLSPSLSLKPSRDHTDMLNIPSQKPISPNIFITPPQTPQKSPAPPDQATIEIKATRDQGNMAWDNKEISSNVSSSSSSSSEEIVEIEEPPFVKEEEIKLSISEDEEDLAPKVSIDLGVSEIEDDIAIEIPKIKTDIRRDILHIKENGDMPIIPESELESLDKSEENIPEVYRQDTFNSKPVPKSNAPLTLNSIRIQTPVNSMPKNDEERAIPSTHTSKDNLEDSYETKSPRDLLYIQDALRNFEFENMIEEMTRAAGILERPNILQCFSICFLSKPSDIIKHEDRQARNRLYAMSLVKYTDNCPLHQKILMSVWRHCTGANKNCPRIGSHWKDMGFTKPDPTVELGSSNMFGLICMLFLACKFKDDVIKMLERSRTPSFNFSFAKTSLKMSEITLNALDHKRLNLLINQEHSAYNVVLMFYAGLIIRWFDQYVDKNYDEIRGNELIQEITKYSKQNPDEVFMLAKSRFNLNKLRQS